jgi:hypothetical protein
MSNCQPTPEVKRIIRAMAKSQLELGITSADDIVDTIHAAIHEHTPLWKNEIADIIAGIGEKRPAATKTELQEKLTELRRQLKEKYHPADEAKNARRQAAIKKQIAKIDEQIRTGDFSKEPRAKPTYDEPTNKLQADLERSRARADRIIRQIEYNGQSRLYKGMTFVGSLQRASILSSLSVFAHLAGASAWRLVSTVLEDAAGAGIRLLPGMGEIDALAKVEGGGFGAGGHIEGLKGAFSKQTVKDMWDKFAKGASDRQVLYGEAHESSAGRPWILRDLRERSDILNYPLLDLAGHLHDAIKTPIENYAFARAYWRGSKNLRSELARKGKSADEIDKVLATDSATALIGARAFEESKAAKLQGKNAVIDRVQNLLREADKSGDIGQAVSAFVRLQMPIMKIPANLAAEIASYAAGGAKALSKYRVATREGASLTPEVADYIVKNLKKQAVGAALGAVGWYGYQSFGGLYRPGKKPANAKLGFQDAEIPGLGEVSHHWTHSGFFGVMQAFATAHYAYDEDRARALKQKMGDTGSPLWNALDGFSQAAGSILGDLPFIEAPKSIVEAGEGGKKLQKFLGANARNFIPGFVQGIARSGDQDAEGRQLPRKPQSVAQEIELGIPGHGFDTPFGHVPGRKDVPDKNPKRQKSE